MQRRILVSLHDVSPAHGQRIFEIIDHLRSLGTSSLALLLVPDFHHRGSLTEAPEFCQQLQRVITPADGLHLHGYYHLSQAVPSTLPARLKAATWTAGEGEFQTLSHDEALDRIHRGVAVLEQALGIRPTGFVAPAWLDNAAVRRALQEAQFRWCEDRLNIHDLQRDRHWLAPALSWASRSLTRRFGSRLQAKLALPVLARSSLVRVAIHPNDYNNKRLVASIEQVLRPLAQSHTPISYADLLGAPA